VSEESAYLTAPQAAAYLGVSRATLYAYVSRGLVASEPEPGSRSHRYPRTGLDELKASRERRHDPNLRAHGALNGGAPLLDSALTSIVRGRLWYRGRDACELSRTVTFEEVAHLLWAGKTDGAHELFPKSAARRGRRRDGSLADRLVACLVAGRTEASVTLSEPSRPTLRAAARRISRLFDAVGSVGGGTLAERLARGWGAPNADDLNAALILLADHELNASSFTARCVASTDAPIGNVLLAALCSLEGRRHGGVSDRVEELLRDAERDGARRASRRILSRDGRLPGFGGRVYPDGDPRAAELLARLQLPAAHPVAQVIRFAHDELGVRPAVELALAAVIRGAGLRSDAAFALFALGRSAGWVAHALEAASEGTLIRPRARYTGPAPA
jgi:citrate synthase